MAATPPPASPAGNEKSELEHQLDAMDHHQPQGILTMKLHTDSDSDDELHGRVDINRHLLEWDPLLSPASTPGSNNPTPKGHYRDRSQTTAGTCAFGRPQLGSITAPSTPVGAQRGIPAFGSPVRPASGGLVSQHLGAFQAREAAAHSQMLPKGINVQPRPPSSTVTATPPSRTGGCYGAHASHPSPSTPPPAPNTTTNATTVTAGKTTTDLAPPPGAVERKRRYSAPKADIGGLLGFWKTQEKKKEPAAAASAATAATPALARQGSSGKSATPRKWQLQQKEREEKEKEQKELQAKAQAEADRKRREAAAQVSAKMAAAAAKRPHDPSLPTGDTTVKIAVTAPVKKVDEAAKQRAIEEAKKKKEEADRIEAARVAEREEKLRKQKEEDDARIAKEAADREARVKAEAERRAAEEKAEREKREEAERVRLENEKKAKEAAEAAAAAEQRRLAAEAEEKRRRDEQEQREREHAAHLAELKRLEAEKADEEEKARLRKEQEEKEAAAARQRELEAKAIAEAAAERERLRLEAEETKKREAEAIAQAKALEEAERIRAEKARQEAEAQRLEAERIERLKHEEEQRIANERAAQAKKEEEEELARQRERERIAESFEDAALGITMEAPPSPMSPPATPGTFSTTPGGGSFALDGNGDAPSPYTAPSPNDSLSALAALPTVRMIGRTSVGGRERSASSGGLPLPYPPTLTAMHSLGESNRVTRESIAAANAAEGMSSPPPLGRAHPSATVTSPPAPALPLTPEEEEKQKKKAEADAIQRQKVREEITSTEQTYVKSLGILVDQFIHPLKSSDAYDVSQKDVSLMFSNVELLYNFHRVFLKEITVGESVGDVLLRYADFLKMYTQYLNGYPRSLQCINDNRNNKKFQAFLAEKRKACGLDLMSYLIMPVQRIPRYELLLREMKRLTPVAHPEYARLCEAFEKIQHIGSHINEEQRQAENMSKLLEIQNRISGEFGTLMQPHRRLVREGQLTKLSPGLVTSTNARLLFLFSDIIVYTTTSHKFRGHCELAKSTIIEHSDKKKHGFEIKYGDKTMIWLCQSEKEKTEWMGEIMGAMNAIREGIEQQMKRRHASRQNKAKGTRGRVDAAHMRQARSHSLLTPEDQANGPGTGLATPSSPSSASSALGSTPMSFSSSPSLAGSPLANSSSSLL